MKYDIEYWAVALSLMLSMIFIMPFANCSFYISIPIYLIMSIIFYPIIVYYDHQWPY